MHLSNAESKRLEIYVCLCFCSFISRQEGVSNPPPPVSSRIGRSTSAGEPSLLTSSSSCHKLAGLPKLHSAGDIEDGEFDTLVIKHLVNLLLKENYHRVKTAWNLTNWVIFRLRRCEFQPQLVPAGDLGPPALGRRQSEPGWPLLPRSRSGSRSESRGQPAVVGEEGPQRGGRLSDGGQEDPAGQFEIWILCCDRFPGSLRLNCPNCKIIHEDD